MFQQLRQGLVGVLHDDIEIGQAVELTPTRRQEAEQVGMSEATRQVPSGEMCLRKTRYRGHELDGNFGRPAPHELSEEYAAVVRSAEIAVQGEHAIDNVSLPIRPDFAHSFRFRAHMSTHARLAGTVQIRTNAQTTLVRILQRNLNFVRR